MRNTSHTSRSLTLPAALLVAAGCRVSEGMCAHTFDDAVLQLTTADARTGAPVPRVAFTRLTRDGVPVADLRQLTADPSARGVNIHGDTLVCSGACAFGTAEGRYELTATAPGYRAATVAYPARYSRFAGGCPSASSGGLRVQLTLAPD